jgi:hypothetical protein
MIRICSASAARSESSETSAALATAVKESKTTNEKRRAELGFMAFPRV